MGRGSNQEKKPNLKEVRDLDVEFVNCLSLPTRVEARRMTNSGAVGGQRTCREVFNRKFSDFEKRNYEQDDPAAPLSAEIVRDCHDTIRFYLYGYDEDRSG